MTHVRRPNRRRVPELVDVVRGDLCPMSGKVRYVDPRAAAAARRWLVRIDPDPARAARLGVYQCERCRDWHLGHRPVSRGTAEAAS